MRGISEKTECFQKRRVCARPHCSIAKSARPGDEQGCRVEKGARWEQSQLQMTRCDKATLSISASLARLCLFVWQHFPAIRYAEATDISSREGAPLAKRASTREDQEGGTAISGRQGASAVSRPAAVVGETTSKKEHCDARSHS